MRRTITVVFCATILLVTASVPLPANAACLATGKRCVVNVNTYDDSLCCFGMVCGWGGVCQAGCRIGGLFYRQNVRNPLNSCQVCIPRKSTTSWSATCFVELFEPAAEEEVLLACMINDAPSTHDATP